MELESHIDETWEMLRAQSAKAEARAEQTMLAVREIFHLSHDLGSVRRFFGATESDQHNAHDLSAHADWWALPADELARELRNYWKANLLPREVQLSEESNRVFPSLDRELEEPFLTAKKKRVFVGAARDEAKAGEWSFAIPQKSYEVWTLLGWSKESRHLHDFAIPQKFYAQAFAKAKKSLKKDEKIPVTVQKDDSRFLLSIHGGEPVEITELEGNYAPLI
jgi:hypothetical protein